VQVFAQNMYHAAQGPSTGEVSAPMLLEASLRADSFATIVDAAVTPVRRRSWPSTQGPLRGRP
jgi:hypothetical protein